MFHCSPAPTYASNSYRIEVHNGAELIGLVVIRLSYTNITAYEKIHDTRRDEQGAVLESVGDAHSDCRAGRFVP